MSSPSIMDASVRKKILTDPDLLLEDADIMRALVAANEKAMGSNIVDLRGVAMERLENRLDRLEDTHRSVIAAAYENLAGTNQIHRAILRILDANKFEDFLMDLGGDVADILRVDSIRLILETDETTRDAALDKVNKVLTVGQRGFVESYVTMGRNIPLRQVTLRQIRPKDDVVYADKAEYIRSEACLKLDFGPGRMPGMLVLGSEDPHQFTPQQGPDLLAFFASVFERTMRRWLG